MYIVHTQQQDAKNHNNLTLLDLGVLNMAIVFVCVWEDFAREDVYHHRHSFVVDVI